MSSKSKMPSDLAVHLAGVVREHRVVVLLPLGRNATTPTTRLSAHRPFSISGRFNGGQSMESDHETQSQFCIHLRLRLDVCSYLCPSGWFTSASASTGTGAAELQGISRVRSRKPADPKSVRGHRHFLCSYHGNLNDQFFQGGLSGNDGTEYPHGPAVSIFKNGEYKVCLTTAAAWAGPSDCADSFTIKVSQAIAIWPARNSLGSYKGTANVMKGTGRFASASGQLENRRPIHPLDRPQQPVWSERTQPTLTTAAEFAASNNRVSRPSAFPALGTR